VLLAAYVVAIVVGFVIYGFQVGVSDMLVVAVYFLAGLLLIFIPPSQNSLMVENVNPAYVAIAMGLYTILQNIASVILGPLYAAVVEVAGGNWAVAAYPTIIIAALGLLCAALLIFWARKDKNKEKEVVE
jgi:MFS family permease